MKQARKPASPRPAHSQTRKPANPRTREPANQRTRGIAIRARATATVDAGERTAAQRGLAV